MVITGKKIPMAGETISGGKFLNLIMFVLFVAGRGIAEKKCPRNPVKDVFAGNLPSLDEVRKDEAKWNKRCYGIGGRRIDC